MGMVVQNAVSWTRTYKGHSMMPQTNGVAPLGVHTNCSTPIATFQFFTVQSARPIGYMDYHKRLFGVYGSDMITGTPTRKPDVRGEIVGQVRGLRRAGY